jgi:5-methylcytosine-specific restriction endonuclease McrA
MKRYWELNEEQKKRRRTACRKWAAKHDRTSYYRKYDKDRQGKRATYKMFDAARRRAAINDLDFTIHESDITIPEHCPICNTLMREAFGIRGGTKASPTLDKVHNEKGYTPKNIAVICKNCNSLKGHASSAELRRIADWIDTF